MITSNDLPASRQRIRSARMATVELTKHLFVFFPHLAGKELRIEAKTAADIVAGLEKLAPGIQFYLCDERGALRTHVNIFIGDERILDRRHLSDPVANDARVWVMQALSGG